MTKQLTKATVNKSKDKCKYYREAENEMFVPSCGVESGVVEIDVHPEDVMEWVYCPFCGREIKLKNHKRHPGLYDGCDDF